MGLGMGIDSCRKAGFSPLSLASCRLWLPAWAGVEYAAPAELEADWDMEAAGVGSWLFGRATGSKVSAAPRSGQALRITSTVVGGAHYAYQVNLVAGKEYRVTGYARSDGTMIPQVFSSIARWTGTNSTDWQPFDVTFTPSNTFVQLLYDEAAPVGTEYCDFDNVSIKCTDANLVSAWRDQTSYGRDVVQATENNKMSWAATGGPNGRPKLSADGISEYLRGTWTQAQPETVFMVLKPSVTSKSAFETCADGATASSSRIYLPAADAIALYAGGTPIAKACDADQWHYVTAVIDGASSSISVDGGSPSTGNVGAAAANGLTLGARGSITLFCDSEFAEIIRFTGHLSSSEISDIENYIKGWSQL